MFGTAMFLTVKKRNNKAYCCYYYYLARKSQCIGRALPQYEDKDPCVMNSYDVSRKNSIYPLFISIPYLEGKPLKVEVQEAALSYQVMSLSFQP